LVLGFKLFSILGQKRDNENRDINNNGLDLGAAVATTEHSGQVNLQPLNNKSTPEIQIQLFDPQFNKEVFVENAKNAYKIILDSYANGDTHTLSELLNIDMMRKFAFNISNREDDNQKHTLTVNAITKSEIEDISVEDDVAKIKINFVSEIINFVTNDKNKLISGHKSKIIKADQLWTFTRHLRSDDPTWTLTEVSNDIF
jgi:predicted lipid-binding transport protein (Tim44 family)